MSKIQTYADALNAIEPKNKIAFIKELMPLINQKLDMGCSYKELIEALGNVGFHISKNTLKTYIYRIRKQNKKQKNSIPENPAIKSSAVKNDITDATENNTEANTENPQPAPTKKPSEDELDNLLDFSNSNNCKYM